MRIARTALLGSLAVLALACTSITIPSIPAIPSFQIPSFELPSGGSFAPGVIPSADANTGACVLVTPAEMSSIMGATVTVTEATSTSCTYTLPNFSAVAVSVDTGDLQTARILAGDSYQDLTVGGLPAASGVFIGQPAVWVQKGGEQLQVLGILVGSDDATRAKIVQIANTAVPRWQ